MSIYPRGLVDQLEIESSDYSMPGDPGGEDERSSDFIAFDEKYDLESDWDKLGPSEYWSGELKTRFKGIEPGWFLVEFPSYGENRIISGPHSSREEVRSLCFDELKRDYNSLLLQIADDLNKAAEIAKAMGNEEELGELKTCHLMIDHIIQDQMDDDEEDDYEEEEL